MPELNPLNSPWRRSLANFVSQPFATRFLSTFVARVDLPILRLTKGRFSPSGYFSGWPIVTLISTGAKSGHPRITPLMGIPDGEKIILIASNYGRTHNPAWYYNLKSFPVAIVITHRGEGAYRAYEARANEREVYWQLAVNTYLGFKLYRERANREIPIMVLEPIHSSIDHKLNP
jgi:deazaflavin-dependent oxidoreductase (nitroreductase family)